MEQSEVLYRSFVFSLYLASTGHLDIFTAKADGTDLRQVTNTPVGGEFADRGRSA